MWTKRLRVLVFVAFVLAASGANGNPGGEPEFCTVTVKEVSHHLVLETDQFQAVFGSTQCKKRYRKTFRVQVAGEPYYARGIPKVRDPRGWVRIPPVLLSGIKRRGHQAPVAFRYEDETLLQIPAGGNTVVIGKQHFDITGKKRTLFVDAAGRVRERDLVLRPRTFWEEGQVGRLSWTARSLRNNASRINSEGSKILQSYSAEDLRSLGQYFRQDDIVKKALQEAIQRKEATQQTNAGDPKLHQAWLGWRGMVVVREKGAAEAAGDASSAQEDKYAEGYPSTSSGLQVVNWDAATYRGKLAMDFRETDPSYSWQTTTASRLGDGETGRGVTVVFEGHPWSTDTSAIASWGIQVFGDPAPSAVGGRSGSKARDIQYSYARHASGSFPKHTATIRVEGGPFGDWVMRITEGGKKLQVGESVIDLTGPKKQILFKYDGSIEVGDEADPNE